MMSRVSQAKDRFLAAMQWTVVGIEVLVALALTALAGGALLSLGVNMWTIATTHVSLAHSEFTAVMGSVLQVFIMVELFRIVIAYIKRENVIPTVLEATLIAVARKFVVFDEWGAGILPSAVGLSALLLAVGVSWWLLAQSNACELKMDS